MVKKSIDLLEIKKIIITYSIFKTFIRNEKCKLTLNYNNLGTLINMNYMKVSMDQSILIKILYLSQEIHILIENSLVILNIGMIKFPYT